MRRFHSIFGFVLRGAAISTVLLALAVPLSADSIIVAPADGYQATDHLMNADLTGLDVQGDLVAGIVDGQLTVYSRSTWQPVYNLGAANYTSTTQYPSFVKFSPNGNSIWVGYTVGGNTDDRIYEVSNFRTAAPTWNYRATLASNFDLAFSGDTAYVSGPNSSEYGADNAVWRLDGSTPTLIASLSGFAASIAFDASGNLYYGTSSAVGGDHLVRFSAQQVAEGGKTMANAEVLSAIASPGSDVAVDSAGHVLFTFNQSENWEPVGCTVAMWNGTVGGGNNYDVIGGNTGNHSYPNVNTVGDVTTDGMIYLNDAGSFYEPVLGLAEISRVPEPSSAILAAIALLAALFRRRRK
jgi:hypothetical protein